MFSLRLPSIGMNEKKVSAHTLHTEDLFCFINKAEQLLSG